MVNLSNLNLKKVILKPKIYEIILILLFLLMIFSNIYKLIDISEYSNNLLFYFSVFVIIIILFKCCNPIVGIFFILAIIKLISVTTNKSDIVKFKLNNISNTNTNHAKNNIPIVSLNKSLEIEQINSIKKPTFNLGKKTYDPILSNTHSATVL